MSVARHRIASAALAVLAIAAAHGTRAAAGYGAVSPHAALALVLWAASMALATMAAWPPAIARTPVAARRWTWRDTVAALGIAALALALRAYALAQRPVLGGDEAAWGVVARDILANGGNPFGYGYYDVPALGEYVTALSLRLGGATVEALRYPSAIAGAVTAALAFAVGARLAGTLAGATAGILVATTTIHVHLSRQGINNVFDGLTALVVVAALERGWVERRTALFAVAGAALAVSQHFYASARVLPLVVVAWIGLRVAIEGRRAVARWRELGLLAFVAGVGAWPQVTLMIADPALWLAPIARQSLAATGGEGAASLAALAPRVRDAALGFVALPMRGPFVPAVPMLAPVAAILFAAGLVALARRWREPFPQLAALWIAGVVAMAALSESTPAGHRYAIAVPIAAVVAGFGASALARLAGRATPRAASAVAFVALTTLALEGAWQAHRYFARMPPWLGASRDVNGEVALDFVARLGETPSARAVLLGAPRMWYRGFHHFAYLRPKTVGRDVEASEPAGPGVAAGCGVARADAPEPIVDCLIAVLPHRERDLAAIRAAVVVVREIDVRAPDGLALYRLVEACSRCGPPVGAATVPATSSTR